MHELVQAPLVLREHSKVDGQLGHGSHGTVRLASEATARQEHDRLMGCEGAGNEHGDDETKGLVRFVMVVLVLLYDTVAKVLERLPRSEHPDDVLGDLLRFIV